MNLPASILFKGMFYYMEYRLLVFQYLDRSGFGNL